MCSHGIKPPRLGQANHKYMGEDYDSSKRSKYIQYLDVNNQYGWAMSKPLPTHGFKWINEEELKDAYQRSTWNILKVFTILITIIRLLQKQLRLIM